jgi:hypothetical protein
MKSMFWRSSAAALSVFLSMAVSAIGGQLTLTGSNEVVLVPPAALDTNVATMQIGVTNSQVGITPFLAGWLFRIDVSGVPFGATGDLLFQSATNPGSSYLLDGNSDDYTTSLQLSFTRVTAFDTIIFPDIDPPVPVDVPATGKYLVDLVFKAGATPPSGTFGIYAVRGFANTTWSDIDFNDYEFTNVPDAAGPGVLIGTVTIVPEPGSISLAVMASVPFMFYVARRRRRNLATMRLRQSCA